MSNIKIFQKSNKTLVTDDDFTLIKDGIRRRWHYSKVLFYLYNIAKKRKFSKKTSHQELKFQKNGT